nr:ATP-binding protein [Deltaproteobacteria bacterium]
VLSVTALRDDDCLEIAVGNNGPAVPVAERDAIFGRYFQVEARRAAARANRGLGLYFCKLAVEAHGGTIHVESRPGLGTVFVIRLPD